MPIYEYRCEKCEKPFSVMQRMGADAKGLSCPACGGKKLTKLISATVTPESDKSMPSSMESDLAKMPAGMGGGGMGGCSSGTCGGGMCGM